MTTTTQAPDVDLAREQLDLLLALPQERPEAWESEHVAALGADLRMIRRLLG